MFTIFQTWLPLSTKEPLQITLIMLIGCSYASGLGPVAFAVNQELADPNARGIGTSIPYAFKSVGCFFILELTFTILRLEFLTQIILYN